MSVYTDIEVENNFILRKIYKCKVLIHSGMNREYNKIIYSDEPIVPCDIFKDVRGTDLEPIRIKLKLLKTDHIMSVITEEDTNVMGLINDRISEMATRIEDLENKVQQILPDMN